MIYSSILLSRARANLWSTLPARAMPVLVSQHAPSCATGPERRGLAVPAPTRGHRRAGTRAAGAGQRGRGSALPGSAPGEAKQCGTEPCSGHRGCLHSVSASLGVGWEWEDTRPR